MKLLFCKWCDSMFSLNMKEWKYCDCGTVGGRYFGNSLAVTNGEGISVGIGNGSLQEAINKLGKLGPVWSRQSFRQECSFIAWVRPNEGRGNPHTKIERPTLADG